MWFRFCFNQCRVAFLCWLKCTRTQNEHIFQSLSISCMIKATHCWKFTILALHDHMPKVCAHKAKTHISKHTKNSLVKEAQREKRLSVIKQQGSQELLQLSTTLSSKYTGHTSNNFQCDHEIHEIHEVSQIRPNATFRTFFVINKKLLGTSRNRLWAWDSCYATWSS